jgi:hypothetical protein
MEDPAAVTAKPKTKTSFGICGLPWCSTWGTKTRRYALAALHMVAGGYARREHGSVCE